jgi:hypothetical protein
MGFRCTELILSLFFEKFWYFCAQFDKMKKRQLTLIFALFGAVTFSQTAEVGFFGGLSYYLGDINPGIHFMASKPAYGAMARFNLDSRWAIKASGYRGKIKGDDGFGKTNDIRGLKFESKITDLSVTAEFNFFDYSTGSRRNVITPYIFGGIGMVIYNPTADGIELRGMGTEGQNVGFDGRKPYSRVAFSLPFGFGFKYSVNKRLCFSGEWGLRKSYTDYLDDVSTTYYLDGSQINTANPEEVLSDPTGLHKPYQERGNSATDDWYNFTGISMTYKFRLYNKNKCPNKFGPEED